MPNLAVNTRTLNVGLSLMCEQNTSNTAIHTAADITINSAKYSVYSPIDLKLG